MKLTDKEMEVLRVLWSTDKALVASEIVKSNQSLNINTVQAALRKLLSKKIIKIADIVYSGTVLSRSYQVEFNEAELLLGNFIEDLKSINKKVSVVDIVSTLLDKEADKKALIEELEKMLKQKREEL